MANRSGPDGIYLDAAAREALLVEFARYEKRKRSRAAYNDHSTDHPSQYENPEGCRICRRDNDHTNMLLCEGCNAEYHFYCIGLRAVPNEDWYCDKCRPSPALEGDDGLDLRVAALPPLFTSRFGEVVFAQGGAGYGMWPCYIYDPRMTVGGARELAKKNLGKKHLVYFFQCHEAPFAALPDSKIVEWYTGLTENYHLGRAAKHTGKNRALQFAEALKIANLELGKPIEHRMDWNHPDPTLASPVKEEILQSPLGKKRRRPPRSRKKHHHKHHHSEEKHDFLVDDRDVVRVPKRLCTAKKCVRTNLEMTLTIHNESASDEAVLFLRVVLRKGLDDTTIPVGFVSFGSRQESTFAEARETIERDVDPSILNEDDWRFYIPELGPVSLRQETSLGPLLPFLQKVSEDPLLGDGTIRKPIKVVLAKNKEINPSLVP